MASETWVFSEEKAIEFHYMADKWLAFDNVPLTEFMRYVSVTVVDGPIDIDWQDRYGWTALTGTELENLIGEFVASFSRWDAKYRSE